MMQAGHSHVAAVCGTAVTKDQVQLLKDLGFTNINIP
jgi:DNA primase